MSLEDLEVEQKVRSDAEQEVVVPQGQVLGTEELNAQLSILKSTRLGMYLLCLWLMP